MDRKAELEHFFQKQSPVDYIDSFPQGVELYMLREDLLHPEISGNKFRKLKFNLIEAENGQFDKLITFGGAHSNHIAAVAAAGEKFGFETLGIIRGEELFQNEPKWSQTLHSARLKGMTFKFVSRDEYRKRASTAYLQSIQEKYPNFYLIPEGGTNKPAVRGVGEMLGEHTRKFDFLASAVGTGGTLAGIAETARDQQVIGIPVLKIANFENDIQNLTTAKNWKLISDYHFGGYAKINGQVVDFVNKFSKKYKIQLDPVYTGKLVFGIFDLIENGYFPEGSKILVIHTGGLQGIVGMNERLRKKKMPQIERI